MRAGLLAGLTAVAAIFLAPSSDEPKLPVVEEVIEGKVVRIADGDTLTILLPDKTQVKVRLEGIDAPESKQAFGSRAKQSLSTLVAGKTIEVHKTGTDKYDRTLGLVFHDGVNINARQVELGFAWHYKEYSDDQELAELEIRARESKAGLWQDENPLPPWEFRRRQRGEPPATSRPSDSPVSRFSGGTPDPAPEQPADAQKSHWLNTSSGVRHNASCQHFANTKRGRYCGPDEGKGCGQCGG